MKTPFFLIVLGAAASAFGDTIDFDRVTAGAMPPAWIVAMTHKGGAPKWEVLRDETAPSKPNVFAQISNDATAGRFPLAIYEKAILKDGTLSVKFKTISGNVDQAAGLVWRYHDSSNYYIVRANALENSVVLYKVENGQRLSLAPKDTPSKTYGVKRSVPKQIWSSLRVRFKGNVFVVSLDEHEIFEVDDSTFTQAGKVGLWTKADSVIYFDDFQIEK